MSWQMKGPCKDCPFNRTGPGARLRRSLRVGRLLEIKRAIWGGAIFPCHKTTDMDNFDDDGGYHPNGKEMECAGAIRWLNRRLNTKEKHGDSDRSTETTNGVAAAR